MHGGGDDTLQVIGDLSDLHGTFRLSCKALTSVIAALDQDAGLQGITQALWGHHHRHHH